MEVAKYNALAEALNDLAPALTKLWVGTSATS